MKLKNVIYLPTNDLARAKTQKTRRISGKRISKRSAYATWRRIFRVNAKFVELGRWKEAKSSAGKRPHHFVEMDRLLICEQHSQFVDIFFFRSERFT
ncbi:hypothetical protein GCM10007906_05660 [Vibrio hyugaensis]|uniref:Uncharacterized protein n=1 Tax=Vibrio hyugaensis TaxID=1534743 RepID=A0ABQ5Y0E7_9VIBR|nr:hypothetical protein GCM10007906_05660 [Vibrio hyugaensis]